MLTDWGSEFAGPFQKYCFDKGIKMRKSSPYLAWMNGLVESKNRRLKEISRCLLIHAGLGPEMWGHSIMAACYILNRKANKHCGDRSPYAPQSSSTKESERA